MGARSGESIGVIYGDVSALEYRFAAYEATVKRLDYVAAEHPNGWVLGQIVEIARRSQLSFDEAVKLNRGQSVSSGDYVSCKVKVLGYRDERGLLQVPRTPFRPGLEVRPASAALVQKVLGVPADRSSGAFIGFLKGVEIPIVLDVNHLVQKHASVLAMTGAGKSYLVGVLIEELLLRRVPLVIIDPHGEYPTLAHPNIEPKEIDGMRRFGIKPKAFHQQVTEYTLEKQTGGRKRLALEGENLEARELSVVLPTKLSAAQDALLHQAVTELRRHRPFYTLRDVIEEVSKSLSNAKWPLVSSLESLAATSLFAEKGTPVEDLVQTGHAAILNLKGTAPQVQEIAVARLAHRLFEARKSGKIPPFMFVVEEAHNFCPERGVGLALSGTQIRTIASEGRKFGMGLLIVSQRPAKVDKNVLSQCNTQLVLKVTNPNDLKAITASVEGITSESAEEIQQLGVGVALVSGGGLAAPVYVEVRTRMSRHGGRAVNVVIGEDEIGGPSTTIDRIGPWTEPERSPVETFEVETIPAAAPSLPPAPTQEAPAVSESPGPWSPDASLFSELPQLESPPASPVAAPTLPPMDLPAPDRPRYRPPIEHVEDRPTAVGVETILDFEDQGRLGGEPEAIVDATEEGPRLRPFDEPEEIVLHRVITRLGYSQARNPRDAVTRVKGMALGIPTLAPDEYVRRFAQVGRTYCYPSMPECGPCPLIDLCKLGQERLARGEVRRGRWGTRPE